MKTYTTAIFETADGNYQGVAMFDAADDPPWFVFLTKEDDDEIHIPLGLFYKVEEGWHAVRKHLNLSEESRYLPRADGEGSDGTPFTPNDRTHKR